MVKMITANTGSLPRIGEGNGGQKLRRAFSRLDRQEINREELVSVEKEVTNEVIALQSEAGLGLLTDGQIRWHDPVSHLMGKLTGVDLGSMARFFDTNTYYRQPIVWGKIGEHIPLIADEFIFAQRATQRTVKPVLTGPYTLARLSVNNAYDSDYGLMEDIARVIAREVKALARAGAEIIQLDEPAILQNPRDMEILQSLLEEIAYHRGGAELALYTYFGDAAPLYDQFQRCAVTTIGMDFTYSARLPEVIVASGADKKIGLGLIDGRNTRMETEADVFPVLEALLALPGADSCYLNPSCGLEYLPRAKAFTKLKNMVGLRDKFMGGAK